MAAVANTKSAAITNADATPATFNNSAVVKGQKLMAVGTVETTTDDDTNSVYRLVRIPSNAVISSIKLFNDDLDSGTSAVFKCGLHQTAANGGAVVDVDLFATALASLQAAVTTGTEIRFAALDVNGVAKRVWELLGLSADTAREYDLTITATTVTGLQAGTLTAVVEYAVA